MFFTKVMDVSFMIGLPKAMAFICGHLEVIWKEVASLLSGHLELRILFNLNLEWPLIN